MRIKEAAQYVGQVVKLSGWVYNLRSSGKIVFPLLRDGSGVIQCVCTERDLGEERIKTLRKLTQESSIELWGKIRASERAYGGYEIDVTNFRIIQLIPKSDQYPLPINRSPDWLLENRHLWLRSLRQAAILRVRNQITRSSEEFLRKQDFVRVDAPIITTDLSGQVSAPEFNLEYFRQGAAHLTSSGRCYNGAAAMALGRVYSFGPVFSARKSTDTWSLAESWLLEPEIVFADLAYIQELGEDLLRFIAAELLENSANELEALEVSLSKLESIPNPFIKISYDDALKIISRKGQEIDWGEDLEKKHGNILAQEFNRPVVVSGFPTSTRSLLTQPDRERPETSRSFSIFFDGYGNVLSGSERVIDYDLMIARLKEHHLHNMQNDWYLDLCKYGAVPRAGFSMSLELVVAWTCSLLNLREAIPFPRTANHLKP